MEDSEQRPEAATLGSEGPEVEPASPRVEVASGSDHPNPFWSDRAVEELRIRQAWPLGLAEFDEDQREPEYFGSETGRSIGFASATGLSARAMSPMPARGSEASSDSRTSNAVSNAPSMTSRSRSPTREEIPAIRDLLVSLGSAVAGLAEEERQTRQRLSVVEEIRSGSTSSMRTGREHGELDSGTGPQLFQIGDNDPDEPRELRSGMLTLEDWVQAPTRLQDIPREGILLGPVGVPEPYFPAHNTSPAQAPGARLGPGARHRLGPS